MGPKSWELKLKIHNLLATYLLTYYYPDLRREGA